MTTFCKLGYFEPPTIRGSSFLRGAEVPFSIVRGRADVGEKLELLSRRAEGLFFRGGEDRPEFDLDQRSDLCQWSYLCSAKYQLKRQDLDQDQDLRSRSYHVHRHTLGLEIFGFCPLPWSHTLCTHTQETGYSLAYCYMQSFAIS